MQFGGGSDSRGPKEPGIRWDQDPPQEGAVLRDVHPTEEHWSVCCSARSKMDHLVVNNGMHLKGSFSSQ